jgi:hypothetical protein
VFVRKNREDRVPQSVAWFHACHDGISRRRWRMPQIPAPSNPNSLRRHSRNDELFGSLGCDVRIERDSIELRHRPPAHRPATPPNWPDTSSRSTVRRTKRLAGRTGQTSRGREMGFVHPRTRLPPSRRRRLGLRAARRRGADPGRHTSQYGIGASP